MLTSTCNAIRHHRPQWVNSMVINFPINNKYVTLSIIEMHVCNFRKCQPATANYKSLLNLPCREPGSYKYILNIASHAWSVRAQTSKSKPGAPLRSVPCLYIQNQATIGLIQTHRQCHWRSAGDWATMARYRIDHELYRNCYDSSSYIIHGLFCTMARYGIDHYIGSAIY